MKFIVVWLLIALLIAVFFRFNLAGGVFFVMLGMGLAIAGQGNRAAWLLIFFLLIGLAAVVLGVWSKTQSAFDPVVVGLLSFGGAPLFPAVVLWSAQAFRKRRARRADQP